MDDSRRIGYISCVTCEFYLHRIIDLKSAVGKDGIVDTVQTALWKRHAEGHYIKKETRSPLIRLEK